MNAPLIISGTCYLSNNGYDNNNYARKQKSKRTITKEETSYY